MNSFSWCLSKIGRRGLEGLARVVAFVLFNLVRLRRQLLLSNIATAFGGSLTTQEQRRLGYLSFYHFALTSLEFLAERQGRLADQVTIVGRDHLESALEQGQGAYILCIHMGSWEAMGGALSRFIKPSYVIVKKVGSPGVDRFVSELRQRNGFYTIPRFKKGDALRGIVHTLSKGEVVGFAMDQARPGEPMLPFFGRPAKTNTSLAAIWRRHPAPILPAYCVRTGDGRHTLHIKPALALQVGPQAEADIRSHSQYFNSVVEGMIKECPEQYFWLHNRWKGSANEAAKGRG